MKLIKARVQNYRSIRDTGEFEVEDGKTILVGPNEAGKSAILHAQLLVVAVIGIGCILGSIIFWSFSNGYYAAWFCR